MNTQPPLYPLMFKPVYKNYIWGGDRIARRYGRSLPPGIYAESWEITDRAEGINVVINGSLAGKDIHELTQIYGTELLGRPQERFPLLIKLIDSKERLSVQVHPDENAAKSANGEAKAEMWYVLDADPGAEVFVGFKPGVNEHRFREALATGKVGDLLKQVSVHQGDVIYIPGGCVHTIGAGALILEVQQNSNTTYRVFDWDRVGANGKPRELHIEQAMKVILWQGIAASHQPMPSVPAKSPQKGNTIVERLRTPYFRFEELGVAGIMDCPLDTHSFHALFLEKGLVRIKSGSVLVDVTPGTTILIPDCLKEYEMANLDTTGASRLLRVSLP
ncbi:MAG: class I mannose-6-phosphate isomerase [Kiritimatiellae bacterium]|nr:class I mannose-6-phosphate isomerase [Kiritimatiellia bacterium]